MNINNDWHTISAEETAKRLKVNPYTGLSEKEVRRRRSQFGKNRIWHVARTETGKAILNAAGDLSTVLLLITAVLALFFEEHTEAVTLCVIVALGALLRIITYVRAKRILEDNAAENIPTAAVLRDGAIRIIRSAELVPGDIVLLHPGDIVPCDGRVISETDSIVSEIGVTENKDQVHKYNTTIRSKPGSAAIPCESRPNILYAGSTVLRGSPRMIASATGEDSLISMKQGGIEIPAGDRLPIIEKLNGRCKASELFMLAFVMVISVLSIFVHGQMGLEQSFLVAVSAAAASMSEFLTAIGFIVIAISARNSKKQKKSGAVIKDCSKIESIAGADRIIIGDMSLLKSGRSAFGTFFANGLIHRTADGDSAADLGQLLALASDAVGAKNAGSSLAAGNSDAPISEREQILRQAGVLFAEKTGKSPFRPSNVIDRANSPLTSGLDLALLLSETDHTPFAAAAGDVQTVLRCCSTYRTKKGALPLTDKIKKAIFTETARMEFIGAKPLAAATRPSPFVQLDNPSALLNEMCFEGFFSIAETPADGVVETIQALKKADIPIILFSSNPEHDLYYGHSLGLFDRNTKTVSHDCPKELLQSEKRLIVTVPPYTHTDTEKDLSVSSARYRVVKNAGEHTAFLTKDPLDSRAVSTVDCGIAVSRCASKAAAHSLKNHAPVVVYPKEDEDHGGFAEGASALKESRRALLNLTHGSLYLTVAQITRLLTLLTGVLFKMTVPSPAALLISGILFDFGAVLAMAFEKAPADVFSIPSSKLPSFPEQIRKTALYGLLSALLTVSVPLLTNGLAPLMHVHPLTGKETVSLLAAALFLTQSALAAQYMKHGPLFSRGTKVNAATVCYHLAVVGFTALLLFEPHTAALLGGTTVPWYGALLALLPPTVTFGVMELRKRIAKKL